MAKKLWKEQKMQWKCTNVHQNNLEKNVKNGNKATKKLTKKKNAKMRQKKKAKEMNKNPTYEKLRIWDTNREQKKSIKQATTNKWLKNYKRNKKDNKKATKMHQNNQ